LVKRTRCIHVELAAMPARVKSSHTHPVEKLWTSKTDTAFDVSGIVLTTLRDVADLTPFPLLKQSAGLALGLLVIVQACVFFSLFLTPSDVLVLSQLREQETTRKHSKGLLVTHVSWYTQWRSCTKS
jgi:hypothetical protein